MCASQQGHLGCVRVSGPQGWAPGPGRRVGDSSAPKEGEEALLLSPWSSADPGTAPAQPFGGSFYFTCLVFFIQAHLGS